MRDKDKPLENLDPIHRNVPRKPLHQPLQDTVMVASRPKIDQQDFT